MTLCLEKGLLRTNFLPRERMEAMEKQIASLTGLVQSALLRGSEAETPRYGPSPNTTARGRKKRQWARSPKLDFANVSLCDPGRVPSLFCCSIPRSGS